MRIILEVRPWVVLAMLDFLIDSNHECFRGKGKAEDLRAQMRSAVHKEYGDAEHTPKDILEAAEEQRQLKFN